MLLVVDTSIIFPICSNPYSTEYYSVEFHSNSFDDVVTGCEEYAANYCLFSQRFCFQRGAK